MSASQALQRMTRGRSALILAQPFFGTLALNLELVETRDFETMATDSRRLFFNPDFVATLTDAEIEFTIAHEVEHCALKHCTRRGERDQKRWNVACDHPVNLDLVRAGFKIPAGALCDAQYAGLGAEEIYRILDRENREQDAQPQDQPQQSGGEDQQSGGGESPQDQNDDAGDQDGAPDEDGEPSDDKDPDDVAGDETEGDDANPDNQTADGDENGAGDAQNGGDESGENPEDQGKSPGPGAVGDVLDAAPGSPGEQGEIEANWDVIVRQAIAVAKAHEAGNMPAYLERLADELKQSKTDWRDVLRRFVTPSSRHRPTWSRASRRFASSGLFMPGKISDGVNHIAWIVDTSASMDEVALAACRAELQAALDEGIVDKFTVVYADTAVAGVASFERGDEIDFKPVGFGGTEFAPAIQWVVDNEPDVTAAIYFTDLDASNFGVEPHFPILWAAYGDPRTLPARMARAPFGECLEIAY